MDFENQKQDISEEIKYDEEETNKKEANRDESAQSTGEKELEFAIRGAPDFRTLYKIVQDNGGLEGSQKRYSVDEIARLINQVGGGADPRLLTGKFGLRQKVLDLIALDKVKQSLDSDPEAKSNRRLRDIDLSLREKRTRLESEKDPTMRAEIEKKIDALENLRNGLSPK